MGSLVCPSPSASFGIVPLRITQNGQQYSNDTVAYSNYLDPSVRYLSVPGTMGELGSWIESKVVHPFGGGLDHGVYVGGYSLVRVWGTGYIGGTDYRCMLNHEDVIAATYDAALDCIECWSDLWLDGSNHVEVTLNGRQYTTDNASFVYNPFW